MTDTTTSATETSTPQITEELEKTRRLDAAAKEIVNRHVLWAMGAGLLPIPGIDLLGITAIQLKMLNELSGMYDVPFSEHRGKSVLGALAGVVGSVAGAPVLFSLFKIVPILGQTAGLVALPLSAGAFTSAVGRVFTQHFASGGTFLDFDPNKVREYFLKEYESAKSTVQNLKGAQ